jgi:hypothetical protein
MPISPLTSEDWATMAPLLEVMKHWRGHSSNARMFSTAGALIEESIKPTTLAWSTVKPLPDHAESDHDIQRRQE